MEKKTAKLRFDLKDTDDRFFLELTFDRSFLSENNLSSEQASQLKLSEILSPPFNLVQYLHENDPDIPAYVVKRKTNGEIVHREFWQNGKRDISKK